MNYYNSYYTGLQRQLPPSLLGLGVDYILATMDTCSKGYQIISRVHAL